MSGTVQILMVIDQSDLQGGKVLGAIAPLVKVFSEDYVSVVVRIGIVEGGRVSTSQDASGADKIGGFPVKLFQLDVPEGDRAEAWRMLQTHALAVDPEAFIVVAMPDEGVSDTTAWSVNQWRRGAGRPVDQVLWMPVRDSHLTLRGEVQTARPFAGSARMFGFLGRTRVQVLSNRPVDEDEGGAVWGKSHVSRCRAVQSSAEISEDILLLEQDLEDVERRIRMLKLDESMTPDARDQMLTKQIRIRFTCLLRLGRALSELSLTPHARFGGIYAKSGLRAESVLTARRNHMSEKGGGEDYLAWMYSAEHAESHGHLSLAKSWYHAVARLFSRRAEPWLRLALLWLEEATAAEEPDQKTSLALHALNAARQGYSIEPTGAIDEPEVELKAYTRLAATAGKAAAMLGEWGIAEVWLELALQSTESNELRVLLKRAKDSLMAAAQAEKAIVRARAFKVPSAPDYR